MARDWLHRGDCDDGCWTAFVWPPGLAVASSSSRRAQHAQHHAAAPPVLSLTRHARCVAQCVVGAQPQPAARPQHTAPQPADRSQQNAARSTHPTPHPIARHCTNTAAAPHWAAPEKAMPPCHSSQLIQAETVALAGLINPLHASPRSDPLRCRPPAAPAKAATSRIVASPYRRAADAVHCSLLPPLPTAHSPHAAAIRRLPKSSHSAASQIRRRRRRTAPTRPSMDPPGAMAIALPRCTSRITGLWPLASPKPVPEPCQYDTTNLDSIAGCGLWAVGWVLCWC
jgi:hypothetical protein